MLHIKFQGHWSIGSGEEVFLRFLPYMGMAAMLVTLVLLAQLNASSKFESQGCSSFQKLDNFHFFPYKSLCDQI